jgi:hypothetical protein
MKITRQNLKDLIVEEIAKTRSVLLEQPADYRYEDTEDAVAPEESGDPIDLLAQRLHHLGRQADTLFHIVSATKNDSQDKITDDMRNKIMRIATEFRDVFEAVEMDHSKPDRGY